MIFLYQETDGTLPFQKKRNLLVAETRNECHVIQAHGRIIMNFPIGTTGRTELEEIGGPVRT